MQTDLRGEAGSSFARFVPLQHRPARRWWRAPLAYRPAPMAICRAGETNSNSARLISGGMLNRSISFKSPAAYFTLSPAMVSAMNRWRVTSWNSPRGSCFSTRRTQSYRALRVSSTSLKCHLLSLTSSVGLADNSRNRFVRQRGVAAYRPAPMAICRAGETNSNSARLISGGMLNRSISFKSPAAYFTAVAGHGERR